MEPNHNKQKNEKLQNLKKTNNKSRNIRINHITSPHTYRGKIFQKCLGLPTSIISSAESQKGINAVQRCSIENQKGTIAIDFVQR